MAALREPPFEAMGYEVWPVHRFRCVLHGHYILKVQQTRMTVTWKDLQERGDSELSQLLYCVEAT